MSKRIIWTVMFYWNLGWHKECSFHSKKVAANHAGKIFGSSTRWKLRKEQADAQ